MITLKNKHALETLTVAGKHLAEMFEELKYQVVPGISTLELDTWIAGWLNRIHMVSQTQGYHGYRHVSCISVNDEVVHGVPHSNSTLKQHDLVKIDVCAAWKGYCADMTRCFFAGQGNPEAQKLVSVAWDALNNGISQAIPHNRVGDISAAIQCTTESQGYAVVREFAGHGIGRRMHEDPEILNYGKPGRGPLLKAGMTLALEPIITAGSPAICIASDGWTAKTVDGSLAAHVEDTVIITEHGPEIVTRL